VQIKGYQWKWQYTYPNDDPAKQVQFMSTIRTPQEEINNEAPKGEYYLHEVDNPLVIPVHERVRFLITSNDVIHSWFVPDFAIKKDAIPGFVNEAWTVVDEPGIYRGQCAELCGKDHAFMPIVVRAVPQDEFKKWLADKQAEAQQTYETVGKTWTMDELMEQGQQVYSQICSTCHQANGQGVPPAFPPLAGSQVVNGPIEAHADVVLHGRPGTAMQAFAEQLNPAEIAGVITYERNSFGNNQGDMIQPKEIDQMLSGTSEE
jgi:cytochrome c oxidase subunit 2